MNGLDPIIATTLATRIDSVLNAVSGSAGAAAQPSGAQDALATTGAAQGTTQGAAQVGGSATPAAGQANSAETTLSNTALALDAILRLDTSLLSNASTQQQTTLLATPPAQAGSLAANLAADTNAAGNAGAQTSARAAENVSNLATLLGNASSSAGTGAAGAPSAPATGAAAPTGATAPAAGTAAAASLAALIGVHSGDPLVNALATALQQAVGNSGLFYESHLAQWLSGTRSSNSLQNEPQAQLNTPAQSAGAPLPDASGGNKLTASLVSLLNPGGAPSSTGQGTLATSAATAMLAGAKTGLEQSGLTIHPDAVLLVRQQLDLLSTSQFQWNGQAWPGTPMSWEISRRDPGSNPESNPEGGAGSDAPADGQIWQTRITLELPVLGKVEAQLSLNAKQLTARIGASAQSAATMSRGSIDLRRRTAAAGLDLLSLQIRQTGKSLDDDGNDNGSANEPAPVESSGGGP